MLDASGELIYVGKAKVLRARLLSYFRTKSRDPKAGRILEQTSALVWEPATSEFAACLRELELIRRWQPRFNVQGQPRRQRRVYVCVGRRPAPYLFLARRPPSTAFAAFGPVPAGRRSQDAVRRVSDWFRLRDCPQAQEMVFAEEQDLFPVLRTPGCLRHEIGCCLAPCAAACTRADYAFHVQAAVEFLEGKDGSPLEILEREMIAASAEMQFERAAVLRDKLELLRWLSGHLERVRQAAQQSFVYPVIGVDGSSRWYLIHRGLVRAALPAPHDADSRSAAVASIESVYQQTSILPGPLTLGEIDGALLVASWFRRYADESKRTLQPQEAVRICLRVE
jgi:excinuclease ABC subunit C